MTPREIAQSYDQLASHWDGEKFNRQNGIAQHERALQFSPQKRHAIDIGCGSSGRIIELLLAAGFATEGLDISPEMLRRAQVRHPQQLFHLADICTWEFPQKYDFNPFLGHPLYHAVLGIPKTLEVISQAGCICRHLEYDQHPEPHLYLIVQKS